MNPDLEFLIACGVLEDVLDEAEAERLQTGLERDAEGLAWSEALGAAYAELKVAPEPSPAPELWARIAASVEAGAHAEAEDAPGPDEAADAPLISIALACSYCHDVLARAEAAYCASCLAPHHGECFSEHGRCAAPGCGETHWVRAQAPGPAGKRPAGLAERLALVLGLGALAGAAVAAFGWGGGGPSVPAPRGEEPRPQISVLDSATSEFEVASAAPLGPIRIDVTPPSYPQAQVVRVDGTEVLLSAGLDEGLAVGDFFLLAAEPTFGQPTWLVQIASLERDASRAERVRSYGPYVPMVGDWAGRCDAAGKLLQDTPPPTVEAPLPAEDAEVYYLTGQPSWRFRYLSSYLNTSSGARLQSFLESADPGWIPPTHPGLSPLRQVRTTCPADLVVLGPTTLASPPPGLREFVESGGGLILLAGDRGLVRDFGPEAALLAPVEDLREQQLPDAPAEDPYLRPAQDFDALKGVSRDELPLLAALRRTRLRRTARALLRDAQGAPLIAQWSVGQGRVLYVGSDELWRLRGLEATTPGRSTLHESVWDELLTRALEKQQRPGRVLLDSLTQPLRYEGEPLPQGLSVHVDLYLQGPGALVAAATLRGSVQPSRRGHQVVIEAPARVELPPGRYGWQACANVEGESTLLGVGWVDHFGSAATQREREAAPFLQLTEDELRARLACHLLELRGGGGDRSAQQRVRDAALALLGAGPLFSPKSAAALRTIVDRTAAELTPQEQGELWDELIGEWNGEVLVLPEGRVLPDEEAQGHVLSWKLFAQAEFAYLQGDRGWLDGVAAYEIANRTLGVCWTPPEVEGIEPVRRREPSRFEPPWAYVLGQLEEQVVVDPRCVPARFPRSARSACTIDPLACLALDGRARSRVDLARRHRILGAFDLERSALRLALRRGLLRDEELRARTRLVRLGLEACEADPSLHPEVVTRLEALLRLLADPGEAGALRGELAKLLARLDAEQRVVVADLAELAAGLERYRADLGRYPEGLRELYRDVGASSGPDRGRRRGWKGPYAMWPSDRPGQPPSKEASPTPTDPWGNRYAYARRDGDGYTLISVGSDQALGGEGAARDLVWARD